MHLTRRQLLRVGVGLAGTGLLGACSDSTSDSSPGDFTLLQSSVGAPVTSGRTISAQYERRVTAGSLLVAIVWRTSVREAADHWPGHRRPGNCWRQAVEYFADNHYGVDLWYCESALVGVDRSSPAQASTIHLCPVSKA